MTAVLILSLCLLAAVLLSALAERTLFSTAVLFLAAGILCGRSALGWIGLVPADPAVYPFIELALFGILFTDGLRVNGRELRDLWMLPGRALLLGLPISIGLITLTAHWLLGWPWAPSLVLGGALSPTDPGLASSLIGREDVPLRLRQLLNVESGFNDGLALPVLLVGIALAERSLPVGALALARELGGGIAIGLAVPWLVSRLGRVCALGAAPRYEPLLAVAVGGIVFAASKQLDLNPFLAGFTAGILTRGGMPKMARAFAATGEMASEALKLSALLIFGSLVTRQLFTTPGWRGYLFMVVVLLAVRPISLVLALPRGALSRKEWWAAAWFGPKGIGSALYGLIILRASIPGALELARVIGLVTVVSIVVHSTSDVPLARWLSDRRAMPNRDAA